MEGRIFASEVCDTLGFKSLIKDVTCYKNPKSPGSTDLILTNKPHSFQITCVVNTGSSDLLGMRVAVLKHPLKD